MGATRRDSCAQARDVADDCGVTGDDRQTGRPGGVSIGGAEGRRPPRAGWLDPGWLFLLPGLVIVAATVLIPAIDDLDQARLARARALAAENYAAQRLRAHADYLAALERGDRDLALSLVAQQLNLAPVDREILPLGLEPMAQRSASPFPELEPAAPPTLVRIAPDSMLQRWTTDDRTRLWLLAGGSLCTLIGLLPATTPRRRPARD